MREPDIYVEGQPFLLRLPGDPMPEGGWRYIGTPLSFSIDQDQVPQREEAPGMQPATSTGLVYHSLPERIIFTVSGQPGVGHAEVLMQGKVATGTQQLDMSTIRHIEIVISTWRT